LAVRKYPDDPEAWYLLGEVLFHRGGPLLADNDEAEAAFERAIALDPTFAPYWRHLLDKVFMDADSAKAASVMATLDRLDPRALRSGDRFAFTVAFGDSLASQQALAGIDTLSDDALAVASRFLGLHPRTFAAQEAVLREDLSRKTRQDPSEVAHLVALYLIRQGKRSAALEQLADPRVPSWIRFWDLYYMSIVGLQPPAELLESAFESFEEPRPLAFTHEWSFGGQRSVLVLSAAYAADRGQWPRHASILQSLRQFAREYAAGDAPNDSTNARIFLGTARALEGYGLWRRGHPEKALSLLEAGQQERLPDYQLLHWWLGRLLLELDRPADALRYFEALRESERDPFAAFEAARPGEMPTP
jgi:tetratricopeptide (TPR) repeat protein